MSKGLFVMVMAFSATQVPMECNPPGWQPGDPIVLDPGAPCLHEPELRTEMELRARAGNPAAASLVAKYYRFNLGSRAEGLKWMRMAAAQGDGDYIVTLASWLSDSESHEEELTEARALASLAAEKGCAAGAMLAGTLWLRGEPSYEKAKHAYLSAFRLGRLDALQRLIDATVALPDLDGRSLVELSSWLQAYIDIGPPNEFMREQATRELERRRAGLDPAARKEARELGQQLTRKWRERSDGS